MALSPDQLKRLSALLDAALDQPESMRASWLQWLDLDDPTLLAMLKLAHVLQTTGKYDRAGMLLDATRDELRGLPGVGLTQ